ncbi:MAG TPA: alpha/beta hydrolase [Candidatus Limnocylindrales bacterium]|nr:alpha/beta hydrolase [Candidatus Limnocylindrales bacterium]
MPWQQRHVTRADQRRIAWLEAAPTAGSDAPTVVLVHGLGTSDRWWAPTIPVLAERYRVFAPDLVGFGRSAGQPVQLDVAADELAAWASAVGLKSATWVGHSMGGQVTIDLAARYPELVERLVLVDAAGLPVSKDVTRHLMNVVRASPFMPLAAYPVAVECVLRCGPVAITRASHQILSTDLETRVRSIDAPTLVVWGGRDTLLPPSYGRRLAAMIPGATYVELERAGHSPQWEAPTEFEQALLSFLEAPAAPSSEPAPATAPTLMPGVAITAPTGGRVVNRYAPVGDWSVHLRVGRPGDVETALDPVPIVFVHGYVQASRSWLPTLKRLARRHLVLAPDLPGFGWTQTAQPALDVPGQAAALASIMDAAGVGRAVLVGSSLGAQVVTQLAVAHPDRALGVVLVGPTFDPGERSLPRQVIRAAGGLLREWPSVWLEHLRDLVLAGPSRIVASLRVGWAHRIEAVLPDVRAPAVVVRGSRDPLVSREWAREAAALMPNARALEIGGAVRAVGQSSPEALARIVDEHVALITAGSDNRTDGALPIPIVTATHRRRVDARPRKARAGPPRA